jgi:chromosome condensin MukBEF complex kleisin-like MukF subunit
MSVEEAITSVYENDICISLDREMMAFLVGTYIYSRRTVEHSMSEADLKDIFSLIDSLAAGDEETLERRGNNAINRLKEQGFFAKIEMVGGAAYVLTALGKAVAQHWEDSENITNRSLIHFAGELRLRLEQIMKAVLSGGSEQHWLEKVELPMRETISELINSIDRRQQGMATAQKKIQKTISDRISSDWLDGIDACEKLLTTTGAALEELHTIILRETDSIQELLAEIGEHCLEARQKESAEAVDVIQTQMEMVRNWAEFSFNEWSRYFHSVHDFIRINVRTDPNRHLADRIKKSIQAYENKPWAFSVVRPPHYFHLREDAFEQPIEEVDVTGYVKRTEIEDAAPIDNSLLNKVHQEVSTRLEREGSVNLVSILRDLLPELDRQDAFLVAGELVKFMANQGSVYPLTERNWSRVGGHYQFQDLTISTTKERP